MDAEDLDVARFMDEGCPNDTDTPPTHREQFRAACDRAVGLSRKHKNVIHAVIIAAIMISLIIEGPKIADLLFVALAVVCEVS